MARAATKTIARTRTPAAPAVSQFPVRKMTVPDALLNFRRTSYGWEDLKGKGDYKEIPRAKKANAVSSAHGYATAHEFRIRTMAAQYETGPEKGKTRMETVYFNKAGEEVPADRIPEEIRADAAKFKRAGYTSKELPAAFYIIRVTDPGEPLTEDDTTEE